MTEHLNAQRLKQIQGLYGISESFRSELDKLAETEINKAKTLITQLSKLSLNETGEEKPVNVTPKRGPGRPKGSVSKTPNKPRVKKEKVVSEPTLKAVLTHKTAIITALAGNTDGLAAGEILEAITAAKHKNYNVPSKQVLYTSLSNLKNDNMVKMIGLKPYTKYILP